MPGGRRPDRQPDAGGGRARLRASQPDFLVIPSAPSYLFWRCPPPELRVPQEWFAGIGGTAAQGADRPARLGNAAAAMRKTGANVVLRGEPDQAIADLAAKPWS